jgi:hypothetical protein
MGINERRLAFGHIKNLERPYLGSEALVDLRVVSLIIQIAGCYSDSRMRRAKRNETLLMNFQALNICSFEVQVDCCVTNGEFPKHIKMYLIPYAQHEATSISPFFPLPLVCNVNPPQSHPLQEPSHPNGIAPSFV